MAPAISLNMCAIILLAVVALFVSEGAPIAEITEVDKRRESTPEILNLEQELKKAAGEDKKIFSVDEPRPNPQIDGLDAEFENELDAALPKAENQQMLPSVVDNAVNPPNLDIPMDNAGQSDESRPTDIQDEAYADSINTGLVGQAERFPIEPDHVNVLDVLNEIAASGPEAYKQLIAVLQEHPEYAEDLKVSEEGM